MTKAIVLDSSVFISAFIRNEKSSKSSQLLLSILQRKNYTIHMPIIVFLEILNSYYRATLNKEATDDLYRKLINWGIAKKIQIINLESHFLIQFTKKHHLFNLKTADAIITIAAHSLNCPLITWDKKILKNCKKKVAAMSPAQFMKKLN